MNFYKDDYMISTDRDKMQLAEIVGFIRRSYWAADRPEALISKTLDTSLCFGLFENDKQIGFARVITDYAVFAYLLDVFITEDKRSLGLGKWLMDIIINYPELKDVEAWMLATKDAHSLYAKYGFKPLENPDIYMKLKR